MNPDDLLCIQSISHESAACYRGVVARRKRMSDLENAVGALLHLRDQMDDFAELQVVAELAEPYDFAEVLRIVAHQAILDKAEQDAIRRLRDLMEAA